MPTIKTRIPGNRNAGRIFTLSRFSIYFEMVAQTGSIRQAASALNVSASAVNRQILTVEQEMELLLFHRHSAGLTLTTAGELLLAAIMSGKRDFESFRTRLEDLSGLRRGLVEMAVVEAVSDRFIPEILLEVNKLYPRVEFNIRTLDIAEIWEAVTSNEVDFGISIREGASKKVRTVATLNSPVGLVVRSDHPLADLRETRLSHAVGLKLILPSGTLAIGANIRETLARHSVNLHAAITSNRIVSIKSLVRSGLGAGLLTLADVMNEVKAREFSFVRLIDTGITPLNFSLFYHVQRSISPAAQTVIDLISDKFNSILDETDQT